MSSNFENYEIGIRENSSFIGKALVISNERYPNTNNSETKLSIDTNNNSVNNNTEQREGSELDRIGLVFLLRLIGFDTTVVVDGSYDEIQNTVDKIANNTHFDLFICVLMAQGTGGSEFLTSDSKTMCFVKDIILPFSFSFNMLDTIKIYLIHTTQKDDVWSKWSIDSTGSTPGKKKILIKTKSESEEYFNWKSPDNSYYGNRFDQNLNASIEELDNPVKENIIYELTNNGLANNTLVAYSTLPNIRSVKNVTHGSIFIYCLRKTLKKYYYCWDIEHIILKTNSYVESILNTSIQAVHYLSLGISARVVLIPNTNKTVAEWLLLGASKVLDPAQFPSIDPSDLMSESHADESTPRPEYSSDVLKEYVSRFTRLLYEVGMKDLETIFEHRDMFAMYVLPNRVMHSLLLHYVMMINRPEHLKFLDPELIEAYAQVMLDILHGKIFVPNVFGCRFAIRHIKDLYHTNAAKLNMDVAPILNTEDEINEPELVINRTLKSLVQYFEKQVIHNRSIGVTYNTPLQSYSRSGLSRTQSVGRIGNAPSSTSSATAVDYLRQRGLLSHLCDNIQFLDATSSSVTYEMTLQIAVYVISFAEHRDDIFTICQHIDKALLLTQHCDLSLNIQNQLRTFGFFIDSSMRREATGIGNYSQTGNAATPRRGMKNNKEVARTDLSNWLVEVVEFFPYTAAQIAEKLVNTEVTSVKKLAQRVAQIPNFLSSLNLTEYQIADIMSGLKEEEDVEKDNQSNVRINKSRKGIRKDSNHNMRRKSSYVESSDEEGEQDDDFGDLGEIVEEEDDDDEGLSINVGNVVAAAREKKETSSKKVTDTMNKEAETSEKVQAVKTVAQLSVQEPERRSSKTSYSDNAKPFFESEQPFPNKQPIITIPSNTKPAVGTSTPNGVSRDRKSNPTATGGIISTTASRSTSTNRSKIVTINNPEGTGAAAGYYRQKTTGVPTYMLPTKSSNTSTSRGSIKQTVAPPISAVLQGGGNISQSSDIPKPPLSPTSTSSGNSEKLTKVVPVRASTSSLVDTMNTAIENSMAANALAMSILSNATTPMAGRPKSISAKLTISPPNSPKKASTDFFSPDSSLSAKKQLGKKTKSSLNLMSPASSSQKTPTQKTEVTKTMTKKPSMTNVLTPNSKSIKSPIVRSKSAINMMAGIEKEQKPIQTPVQSLSNGNQPASIDTKNKVPLVATLLMKDDDDDDDEIVYANDNSNLENYLDEHLFGAKKVVKSNPSTPVSSQQNRSSIKTATSFDALMESKTLSRRNTPTSITPSRKNSHTSVVDAGSKPASRRNSRTNVMETSSTPTSRRNSKTELISNNPDSTPTSRRNSKTSEIVDQNQVVDNKPFEVKVINTKMDDTIATPVPRVVPNTTVVSILKNSPLEEDMGTNIDEQNQTIKAFNSNESAVNLNPSLDETVLKKSSSNDVVKPLTKTTSLGNIWANTTTLTNMDEPNPTQSSNSTDEKMINSVDSNHLLDTSSVSPTAKSYSEDGSIFSGANPGNLLRKQSSLKMKSPLSGSENFEGEPSPLVINRLDEAIQPTNSVTDAAPNENFTTPRDKDSTPREAVVEKPTNPNSILAKNPFLVFRRSPNSYPSSANKSNTPNKPTAVSDNKESSDPEPNESKKSSSTTAREETPIQTKESTRIVNEKVVTSPNPIEKSTLHLDIGVDETASKSRSVSKNVSERSYESTKSIERPGNMISQPPVASTTATGSSPKPSVRDLIKGFNTKSVNQSSFQSTLQSDINQLTEDPSPIKVSNPLPPSSNNESSAKKLQNGIPNRPPISASTTRLSINTTTSSVLSGGSTRETDSPSSKNSGSTASKFSEIPMVARHSSPAINELKLNSSVEGNSTYTGYDPPMRVSESSQSEKQKQIYNKFDTKSTGSSMNGLDGVQVERTVTYPSNINIDTSFAVASKSSIEAALTGGTKSKYAPKEYLSERRSIKPLEINTQNTETQNNFISSIHPNGGTNRNDTRSEVNLQVVKQLDSVQALVPLLNDLIKNDLLLRDEDYVVECLRCLVRLASVSKENVTYLGREGSCEVLLQIMKSSALFNHRKSVALVGMGLRAISCLSASKDNQVRLGQSGACQFVVKLLSTRHDTMYDGEESGGGNGGNVLVNILSIAEQGLWAIRNLAVNRENQVLLGDAGVCPVVVEIMTIHASSSVSVTEQGMRAITNLAVNSLNRSRFESDTAACTVLVQLLTLHGFTSAQLAEAGLWAIRNLAALHECQVKLGRDGACKAVVDIIAFYGAKNLTIAELGLRAIINLSVFDENKVAIGQVGGCKVVVDMLNFHGSSSMAVAEQGLWAIRNLSTDNTANQMLFGREGACELVVIMIRWYITVKNSHNENIAIQASNAICNLAYGSYENKMKLNKLKAINELQAIINDPILSQDTRDEAADIIEELR